MFAAMLLITLPESAIGLSLLVGLGVALLSGALSAGLYVYSAKNSAQPGVFTGAFWTLPFIRGGTMALATFMLFEPIWKITTTTGTTARVLLYVDASASMKATDEQMELARKLRLVRRLGWITGEAPEDHAAEAVGRLVKLRQLIGVLESGTTRDVPGHLIQCRETAARVERALEELDLPGWDDEQLDQLREDIVTPLQKLDPEKATASEQALVIALRAPVNDWEKKLLALMPKVDEVVANLDAETQAALDRFDRTPRWQRLEAQLLGGADSVADQLAAEHNVELMALTGRRFEMLWHPGAIGEADEADGEKTTLSSPPETFNITATNLLTDLATGIEEGVLPDQSGDNLIVVLFSDGQHNVDGASPLEMARLFKDRGVPVHVVGLGTVEPARDLAVLKTEAPASVYPDARLNGHVILHDGMPSGKPFTVRIEHQGKVVWQQDLVTTQKRRKIPFDFPIKDIVEAEQAAQSRDLRYANLPLAFNVVVPPIPGEMKDDNNAGVLRVNVVTQKPRILVVDGRPRWEFRYLKNMLERDERWDANVVLCKWAGSRLTLGPRGNSVGKFPATRELLFQYQLIVLGDVSPGAFARTELQWLRDFVQFNGGGLICIDGRLERQVSFAATPVGDLYPVRFLGNRELSSMDLRVRFRSAGGAQAPLMLAASTAENIRIWNDLPGPRWAAMTEALPGAETLLQITEGNTAIPGLVFRRFGAGRVLYAAFDESWRWRFNVGDLHHQRYWNQVAKWIMEPPFAVQDAYIAMDSGPTSYDVKDTADIRVRIMNPDLAKRYQADPNLKPEAQLFRDGQLFATVPLEPDPESFTYRARTAPLEPGDYEVRVKLPGVPEDAIKARTAFTVASNPFGELGRLHCDELLLRQMASDSGGQYYREEDMRRLIEDLGTASDRKDVTTTIIPWQKWYLCFLPIMTLLTLEWVIRRTKGLV